MNHVKNIISSIPNPLINQQFGIKNTAHQYCVSVVIDRSISCFNNFSVYHSFQTIRVILSSLATINLPCFDLIVTGNPKPTIICPGLSTICALSPNSSLYGSLFALLQHPILYTNLSEAIHAAFDLNRIRSTNDFFSVLTDGLFGKKEKNRIREYVNFYNKYGIEDIIGVGIGNYPDRMEDLFQKVAFSANPKDVMKAISKFYKNEKYFLVNENKLISLSIDQPTKHEIISTFKKLIHYKNKPIFADLKNYLMDVKIDLNNINNYYFMKCEYYTHRKLYEKNVFSTQKILVVMLWDNTLSKSESPFVNPKYINEPNNPYGNCIKSIVGYFGITLKIVQNYKDAITELTKQTKPGFCDYYAIWVFCGPPSNK